MKWRRPFLKLALLAAFVLPARVQAGTGLGAPAEAPFAVYAEGTTLVFLGSAGVAFGYRPLRGLAVSAGVGASYLCFIPACFGLYAGQFMAHGLFGGDGPHSFEAAAGVSPNVLVLTGEVGVGPAAFLGYRYHPLDGGFVFRGGGGWNYGVGVGLNVSLGYAF